MFFYLVIKWANFRMGQSFSAFLKTYCMIQLNKITKNRRWESFYNFLNIFNVLIILCHAWPAQCVELKKKDNFFMYILKMFQSKFKTNRMYAGGRLFF